ncbi:MAG: MarR family transcriptional regulator [Azospirillaceae bacterium]
MSSRHPPTDFRLDAFLPYRISVLASRVSRRFGRVYGSRFDLSIPEWRLIAHLAQSGAVSVREIFDKVDMDKPKVSRAARRLEDAGLIDKRTDTGDRRLVQLSLTVDGERLFREIEPLAKAFEASLLADLTDDEVRVFERVIDRLMRRLDETDDTDIAAPERPLAVPALSGD